MEIDSLIEMPDQVLFAFEGKLNLTSLSAQQKVFHDQLSIPPKIRYVVSTNSGFLPHTISVDQLWKTLA